MLLSPTDQFKWFKPFGEKRMTLSMPKRADTI